MTPLQLKQLVAAGGIAGELAGMVIERDDAAKVAAKCMKEMQGLIDADKWVSAFDKEPDLEQKVLLQFESGEMVTGWRRQLKADDIYYCIGNEYAGWDFEFNYDLGGIVIYWKPLEAKL